MSELRLVPPAALAWAMTLSILLGVPWLGILLSLLVVCAAGFMREWGQAVLTGSVSAVAAALTMLRRRAAEAFEFPGETAATVATAPTETSTGGWLVRVRVTGYPAEVPVFSEAVPDGLVTGTSVLVHGAVKESSRPGVGGVSINGDISVLEGPEGFDAFVASIREAFRVSVEAHVSEHSRGLIPGMVLGDTSLQSAAERDVYIVSGLSHLSAVSGANVAILVTAVVLIARALRAGLYTQICLAGLAVVVFAGIVGAEPSVLRATITGLVGLVAVLASSRSEPMHALCLAVISLVLLDSDLAVNYGFALSVAATVGIVVMHPFLYRALAPTGWPDILVRALSVAVAADIMTMPIISLMTGQVSLVSVGANVLVAAATAPVTILGLLAAVLAALPGGLEVVVYPLIQPFTWWIYTVGHTAASFPQATIAATPLAVAIGYGWVIAGFLFRRAGLTLGVAALVLIGAGVVGQNRAPEVELGDLVAHVVDTRDDVEPVPPGTELVVVLDNSGRKASRGSQTAGGIPVIFPNRDGEVSLHVDGTQHAADGRF
ncbi:ComEC/Rec2 family competence protein [Corynebacterium lubricantis]|uniref:ComEC/Rec2 family competence protein n=1 Tax=Corynebacterium lubricantis TaxID=541095 RepID=UPI000366EDED|nr:ComEC/Rec2 family competence protein [Corynebacterium lubricantis]